MLRTFKLDTREFSSTLRRYAGYSKRALPVILNTKAFYIARRATVETPKASSSKIAKELREPRLQRTVNKKGRATNRKTTLGRLIIMARRARAGLPGLSKTELTSAVKGLIAARKRSVAFLKSGWLPAIKRLEPLAERVGIKPRVDVSGKQYGRAKGSASPAVGGFSPRASITNDALPKARGVFKSLGGNRQQALKFAGPALQRAFGHEMRSMKDYIERKLREEAQRATIKTN